MRFKVQFFHDDEADLKFAPLGRLILTEAGNNAPMMKSMIDTATRIGANRFDVRDENNKEEFKRVRLAGDGWKSNMVGTDYARTEAAKELKKAAIR